MSRAAALGWEESKGSPRTAVSLTGAEGSRTAGAASLVENLVGYTCYRWGSGHPGWGWEGGTCGEPSVAAAKGPPLSWSGCIFTHFCLQ